MCSYAATTEVSLRGDCPTALTTRWHLQADPRFLRQTSAYAPTICDPGAEPGYGRMVRFEGAAKANFGSPGSDDLRGLGDAVIGMASDIR